MHKILMDLIFAFLTGRHCLQSVVTKLSSVVACRDETCVAASRQFWDIERLREVVNNLALKSLLS